MKTVLVVSYSNLAADARVNRQLRWLSESYQVIAAGLADPGLPGVHFISLKHTLPRKSFFARAKSALQILAHQYERHYWRLPSTVAGLRALHGIQADLVLANDIEALPVTTRLPGTPPVIFDSHEYAPRQFDNSLIWKVFLQSYRMYLCRAYIPRAAAMLTVCRSIADQYEADTGVKPLVLTNAAEYYDIQPQLKPEGTNRIRMIHHGAASPPREIERMIRAVDHLDDRFELDLLLVPGSRDYIVRLEAMARPNPRIRCLPPVPMQELVRVSSGYDIGLFLVPPTTFNLRHTLPNKFFEFIQARLAVAIGPSPEMARIVRESDCGVIAPGFSARDLAAALSGLTQTKINHFKRQSHSIARELSAERNKELLLNLVAETLKEPCAFVLSGGDRVG